MSQPLSQSLSQLLNHSTDRELDKHDKYEQTHGNKLPRRGSLPLAALRRPSLRPCTDARLLALKFHRYANQCKSLTSAGVQSDLPMDFFMDRYAEAYKAEMEVSG